MPTPILKESASGVYYAWWSVDRRSRRKSMGTKSHAVAEQRFAQWLLLGGHQDQPTREERKRLTVADLFLVYETKHVQREVVNRSAIKFMWNNLQPFFGKLTLDEITPDLVEDYEIQRAKGKIGQVSGASTVRKELLR